MAANRKYIVIRTRDLRELLNPEQQKQFADIIEAMNAARVKKDPNKGVPLYFTLNAADKYAVPALEAYVRAIDEDEANTHNIGVQEARAVAVESRQQAIMRHDGTKLPT